MRFHIDFKSGHPVYLQLVEQVRHAAASGALIEMLPGKGCFLKDTDNRFTKSARHKLLVTELDRAVVTAHHLQIDRDDFIARAEERLDHFERGSATAARRRS